MTVSVILHLTNCVILELIVLGPALRPPDKSVLFPRKKGTGPESRAFDLQSTATVAYCRGESDDFAPLAEK
jgi:hypothetical protein